jgi:hypothetical protein
MNSKIKKKVDILFCGLIRKEDLLRKSIKDMVSLRKKGLINNIIFSTWDYEVENNPEVSSFLRENGVIIIGSKEPSDWGKGNMRCQMKSLGIGLKRTEKGRFVLKTRPDVYIPLDFLEKVLPSKEKLKITKDLPKGNIFKYKIWIPWFEITQPFFIGDEFFFGYREDLKFLADYSTIYDKDLYLGPEIHHIRRFIKPFLKQYPIFYSSLKKPSIEKSFKNFLLERSKKYYDKLTQLKTLQKISQNNRFKTLNKLLKQDNFINYLAAYYSILYSHFYIQSPAMPDHIIYKEYSKPLIKLNTTNIDENFSKKKTREPYRLLIQTHNQDFLNNLCEGKVQNTPLAKRFIKALNQFNNTNN